MLKERAQSVGVQFGGSLRTLKYNYNALAELQHRASRYSSDVAPLKAIRDVVWAGLLAETLDEDCEKTSRTLSVGEVGEILLGMSQEETDALVASVMEARGVAEPPK